MNKPTNAVEMRELLLDYIDALLLGGIPKVELDPPKEEADIEKRLWSWRSWQRRWRACTRMNTGCCWMAYPSCTAKTGELRRSAAMRCSGRCSRCSLFPGSLKNALGCCGCWTM